MISTGIAQMRLAKVLTSSLPLRAAQIATPLCIPSLSVRFASTAYHSSLCHTPAVMPWLSNQSFMDRTFPTKPLSCDPNRVALPHPFSIPPPPEPAAQEDLQLTSVLRKRRLKMNKHKYKKLRKRTHALRKRLGK